MILFRFSCILILTVALLVQPCFAAREPTCSKFDYDEKLLEKMIRMEVKVEQMMDFIKQTQDNVLSLTTDLAQRVENVENNAVKFQERVNETIKSFTADKEQEINKLKSLVEKPSVPVVAFNARRSSSVKVAANDVIVFDTVILNEGEGYDSATGIFTAPQAGLYYFSAHACNTGNKAVHYAIVVGNTRITTSTQYDTNSIYSCSSVTAVALLKSEERAWIMSIFASDIHQDAHRWNSFVGALLNQ